MAANPLRTIVPRLREVLAPAGPQAADRELLRRFNAGRDEAAFAEIVRRHGPMLLRVCQRVLRDDHDAEDICQAAFLLLARKATSIAWSDSVAGWLFQTAYRLSLKARTAAARRARHEAAAPTPPQPDPVAELTVRELQAALDDELNRLPEKYRAPIVLCCLEGRPRDEAASCLGWRLATVKDRLERGREHLRLRLARRGVQLGAALTSAWLAEGAARAGLMPHATARAALLLSTGQATLAGLLPPQVAALAKGVTTTMGLCRMTVLAAGLTLALGAVNGLTSPGEKAEGQPSKKAPGDAPPAVQPKAKPAPADSTTVQPEALPLAGHKGAVKAIAFAPDSKAVVTAGTDGTVLIWDPSTGARLRRLEQPGEAAAVAFSPDGRVLATVSGGRAGEVILWDALTGRQLRHCLRMAGGGSGAVAFSRDGARVVAGFGHSISGIDVSTGKLFFIFKSDASGANAAAFSPDGKAVAVANGGSVLLLDSLTGQPLRRWPGKDNVTALAYFPDGTKIAAADGADAIRIFDVATGKQDVAFAGKRAVHAVAFTPDGRRLVSAGAGGSVVIWDVSGKQERQFSAGGAVQAVAFSPDGKRLATAGANGAVVWDLTRDEKPLPKDFKLAEKQLPGLWADLASDEGGKAYAAARMLRADPARAVPFLRKQLEPRAPGPDMKRIRQLVTDLDADEFKKREAATKDLEALGKAAEAALRAALAGKPSPEVKARAERLLRRLGGDGRGPTPEEQRELRAVRLLEQAGTPEARAALEALSKGPAGQLVTQEAKEALGRLTRRN